MEDVYKVIDDIHMKNIEHLDEKVNRVLQSDDHDALFMLGETLYKYGIVDQGVKIFEELYLLYPDENELLVYYIEGLIDQNDLDKAHEVLYNSPHSTEKLMLEADLYQQQGLFEVGIEKLIEAKEMEPDDIVITFALAEMYYYDGQYLKAISNYETITQTGEDIINGISIYARMADASLQSGAYEEAIKFYENVSEMDMTAEDYFKQAISYQKNDLTREAIKQLEKLLQKDPDFMQAYHYLLQIYESEKDYEKAIEIGKEGLRLNAYYKELMTDTARLMLTTNDEHGAILLQDALTVDPSYTEAAIILADYYREKDNITGLINLLTYVDHEDIDPVVAWHVAYAFGEEERDKEAQHFYELAYPDLTQNIDFLNDYYHYLIEIGHVDNAKNILESVRKLDPENPYWDQEYERLS